MNNHPKIYCEGKRRTIDELENLSYEIDDLDDDFDINRIIEINRCFDELSKHYNFVPDGHTWNGDDAYYQNYKRVLK